MVRLGVPTVLRWPDELTGTVISIVESNRPSCRRLACRCSLHDQLSPTSASYSFPFGKAIIDALYRTIIADFVRIFKA